MGSVDDWFCNCDQAITYREALEEVLDIVYGARTFDSIEDIILKAFRVKPFPDCEDCEGTGDLYTKRQVRVECDCIYRKEPWE